MRGATAERQWTNCRAVDTVCCFFWTDRCTRCVLFRELQREAAASRTSAERTRRELAELTSQQIPKVRGNVCVVLEHACTGRRSSEHA